MLGRVIIPEQLAFTVEEFITVSRVGRTKAYEEIASGRLTSYQVGRRRYVSARAADEWQRRREAEAAEQQDVAKAAA